jgi:hypothetical protein
LFGLNLSMAGISGGYFMGDNGGCLVDISG